ncbi:MAG: hypothetical protein MJY56_05365 [Bacteroidales bacterium]|nr:hypothetical protein [Bacteroidales bacterium]
MKKFFFFAVATFVLGVACTNTPGPVPVLHVTDLTRPYGDPDDHWDAACEFALAKAGMVDLKGVVIDNLPAVGDPDIAAVSQLNWLTSLGVPVGVGQAGADGEVRSGLEMIRRTLDESPEPVAIHVLGGCLDVVKAAELWPDLFATKVKAVYLNAGSAEDSPILEYNVALHPTEYAAMFSLPCPVYWMPCMQNVDEWCAKGGVLGKYCTYYRFRQGRIFDGMSPELLNYFNYALSKADGRDWLRVLEGPVDEAAADEFGGQMRNMWCTAGFLHCAGLTVWKDGSINPLGKDASEEVFRFVPITASCSAEGRVSWSFDEKSEDRYIFEVTDLDRYEEAMISALSTLMGWL